MRDLLYLSLTVGFFALAGLLVSACDRIVGPDPAPSPGDADGAPRPVAEAGR